MKKIFLLSVVFFLTWLNVKSLWVAGFPYTHDGENHLARFANYKIAIKEGQWPPRFAPNLLNHYGYPVFNYNYPLANILSLPLSAAKISYQTGFKIIASFFVLAGLWGMEQWLRRFQLPTGSRLFGLLIYGVSPYLLNSIIFRGNIGEIMAYNLLPWLLWVIEAAREQQIAKTRMLAAIALWAGFFLSHNVSVLFATPLLLIWACLRLQKNRAAWGRLATILAAAVGLTLWFWLPAVMEKKFIILDNADLSQQFADHFPSVRQLFLGPWQFGFSYAGGVDSLSFALGWPAWSVLIIFSLILIKKSCYRRPMPFWQWGASLLAWLLIIFQLKITLPIWQSLPLVRFIQFPWRLSLFIYPFLALLAGYFWLMSRRWSKAALFLLALWQLTAFARLRPVDYFHHQNFYYDDHFAGSTTTANENLPKSFTFELFQSEGWQRYPEIMLGEGEFKVVSWNGSRRSYRLDLQSEATIIEPTMNFPGWQTWANGQKVDYFDNQIIGGRIAYRLPAGRYLVESRFTQQTWPRLVGNGVGLLTLILLFLFWQKQWPLKKIQKLHRQTN